MPLRLKQLNMFFQEEKCHPKNWPAADVVAQVFTALAKSYFFLKLYICQNSYY